MGDYRTTRERVEQDGVWNVARGAYEVREEDGSPAFYQWHRPVLLPVIVVKSVFILIGVAIIWGIVMGFFGWSGPHPETRPLQLAAAIEDRYKAEVWPLPDTWDGSQDFEVEAVQEYGRPGEYWQDPLFFWDCILHPGEAAEFLRLRCPDPVTGVMVELPEGGADPEDGPVYRLNEARDGRPVTMAEVVDLPITDPLWDLYMAQEAERED